MKTVHLELAQESRRHHLVQAEFGHIGCVLNIPNTHECQAVAGGPSTELDGFIRVPQESFLDFRRPQTLQTLSNLCVAARPSEEFFLIANATGQWLRTVIGHEDLPPEHWTEANFCESLVISDIIIHSNVLPYDLLKTIKHGSVHFPPHILQEALKEGKTLKTKLKETGNQEFCESGRYQCWNGNCKWTSKLFRNIQAADVKHVRLLYGTVSEGILLITWKGGQFVQKVFEAYEGADEADEAHTRFGMELKVVKRLSHPNIVYSFGKLDQSSYFMEYMSNNLYNVIVDRIDRVVADNKPPFVAHEAVDVLSQVAKAMRHMHQENVVHCDLKSVNILVSEIETPYNLNGKHYLVKVADFGSARVSGNSSSGTTGFIAGPGTTYYSAPEVLQQRNPKSLQQCNPESLQQHTDKARLIEFPLKIDVYSFGIVAFEVLTGILTDPLYEESPRTFKREVVLGIPPRRPPLGAECEKHKETFIQDKDLKSLIEKCWDPDPSQRPSFVKICDELDKAKVRIPEQSHNPPHQVSSIVKLFGGSWLPGKKKDKK